MGIYRECNEHLRASDSKRNQLIAFYGALSGLLFGFGQGGSSGQLISSCAPKVVYLAFGIFGIFASLVLVTFRKWHIVYVNTAMVIQYLSLNKIKPNRCELKRVWSIFFPRTCTTYRSSSAESRESRVVSWRRCQRRSKSLPSKHDMGRFCQGLIKWLNKNMSTELFTFWGFLGIAFIPLYFLLSLIGFNMIYAIIFHLIYGIVFEIISRWHINEALKNGYECSWLLKAAVIEAEEAD